MGKAFADQKITVAVNKEAGNAGIYNGFNGCGHFAVQWVGIVVAYPGFEKVAKNVQCIGLARVTS